MAFASPPTVRVMKWIRRGCSSCAASLRWSPQAPGLSIKKTFDREGIPTPSSGHPTRGDGRFWSQAFLKKCVTYDAYRPHTYEELQELLHTDAVSKLDPDKRYGIWWFGRQRHTYKQKVKTTADGARHYRKSKKSVWVPPQQWIGVPVPDSGISRALVDAVREAVKHNRSAARVADRIWELSGGLFRCGGCGRAMSSVQVGGTKRRRFYYRCPNRATNGIRACGMCTNFRAEKVEAEVWEAIRLGLTDPEQLEADLDRMIEQLRVAPRGDPDRGARYWLEKMEEATCKRSRFQHAYGEGVLSLEDLKARLADIEELENTARRELRSLKGRQERIAELERDRDALLREYARRTPEALNSLTSEQRHQVYKMLRLKVVVNEDGSATLSAD